MVRRATGQLLFNWENVAQPKAECKGPARISIGAVPAVHTQRVLLDQNAAANRLLET
jgi:hypothetical protein